ncbi:MAG: flavodoxin family protein [Proteobacteria bacterium]|nr:flavodoxin family protein [Pseudomonadota bacterium]
MRSTARITAILGTYRQGGIIDRAVEEILSAAREQGAVVSRILLTEKDIAYCTNCRACTQAPGKARGTCVLSDDLAAILDEIEASDAIILASPMNFGTVTAVMKTFIERLVGYAYWPWGAAGPKIRNKGGKKPAVLVASSAAPAFLARRTTDMISLMGKAANLLGARTEGVLFIGLGAWKQHQELGWMTRRKARRLGRRLASRAS